MSNLYLVTFLATLFILLLISGAIVMRSYFLRRRYQRRLEEALASGLVLAPRAQGGKRKRFGAKPGLFEVYLRASTHPTGTHPTSTGTHPYPTPTDKFGAHKKYGPPSVGVGDLSLTLTHPLHPLSNPDPSGVVGADGVKTLPWGSWSTILPLSAQPIFVKRKYRGIAEPSSASPGRLVSLTRSSDPSAFPSDPWTSENSDTHPANGPYTILTTRPPPSRVLNFFGIDSEAYVAAYASAQEAEFERGQQRGGRNYGTGDGRNGNEGGGRTPAQERALARWIGDMVSRPRNRLRRSATTPASTGATVELESMSGPHDHPQQPHPQQQLTPQQLTPAQERAVEGQWALWQRMHEAGFPFDGPPPIEQMRRAALADLQAHNTATATTTTGPVACASSPSNNAARNAPPEFPGLTDAQVEMLDGEERLLYRMWESGILPSLPPSFALHARTENATTAAPVSAPVSAPPAPLAFAPAISTNGITAQGSSREPQPQELTETQERALEGQRDLWQRMHEAGFPFDGPPPIEQMRRAALADLQAHHAATTTTAAPAPTASSSSSNAARNTLPEFPGLTDAQVEMLDGEERLLYRMWESGILPSLPSSFALHARTENVTTTASVSTPPVPVSAPAVSMDGITAQGSSREPRPQELTETQERVLEGQRDLWQRMHEAGFPFDGPPPIEQMRRAALADLQAANTPATTAPAATASTSSNSAARTADEFPGLTDAQIEMLDGQQRLVYRMWESGILPNLPSSFTRLAHTLNADANAASSTPAPSSPAPPVPSGTAHPQALTEAQERALVGQWALWERMREAGFPFDPAPTVEQIRRDIQANSGAARPRESEDDDEEPEGSVVVQMTDGTRVMGVPMNMPGSADDSDSEDEDGISGAMMTPTQRQMPVQAPGQASRVVVAADAPASASVPAPYTLALAAMPGATTAASRLSAPVSTGTAQQQIDPSVKIRVEMLQIAVLIAMPSPHRKSRKSSGKSKVPATPTTTAAPRRASLDEDMDEIVSIADVDADEDDEEDEWEVERPLPEVVLGVSRVQYQHPSSTSSAPAPTYPNTGTGDEDGGPGGSSGRGAGGRAVLTARANSRRPTTTTTTRGGSLAFGIPG